MKTNITVVRLPLVDDDGPWNLFTPTYSIQGGAAGSGFKPLPGAMMHEQDGNGIAVDRKDDPEYVTATAVEEFMDSIGNSSLSAATG